MKKWVFFTITVVLIFTYLYCFVSQSIQNVFDEMYYGHNCIFLNFLFPATYDRYGLRDIHDSIRHMTKDTILEYFDDSLLDKGEVISVRWYKVKKKLSYRYQTPVGQEGYFLKFSVEYYTKDNILIIHPVILTKDAENETHNFRYVLDKYSINEFDVEEIFYDGFMRRVTNRWFDVNENQSHFSQNDFGEIVIVNQLLDSIPD